jgi:hypothetical protein
MIWRREYSSPYRDSNSDPSVVQPVASRYPDSTATGDEYGRKQRKLRVRNLKLPLNFQRVLQYIILNSPNQSVELWTGEGVKDGHRSIDLILSLVMTERYIFLFSWGGVRLSPLGMSATNWPTVLAADNR